MTAAAPDALLVTIGQALLEMLDMSVLSDVAIKTTPEFVEAVWRLWDARADYAQKCEELRAVAAVNDADLDDLVDTIIGGLGLPDDTESTQSPFAYLRLLPATIRRHCRRPANPCGTTLPLGIALHCSEDLLPFLPPRLPMLQTGDRPWGIGDWELRELIEMDDHGEVWKAVNPRAPDRPPVALRFFTSPAARKHVQNGTAAVLDRVSIVGRLPGIVPLQQIHLFDADPPCVQYPYLQAADLTTLVQEWHETWASIDPAEVTDLLCQIAQTLGKLHTQQPPIVHGKLSGGDVLLMRDATGRRRCLLANVGLSGGEDDTVASDVCAVGTLWYQLLVGDLSRPRPTGGAWRRRLVARGMLPALVELLEACIDDEPSARPANCAILAAAMQAELTHAV